MQCSYLYFSLFFSPLLPSLSPSLSQTHTHTHTHYRPIWHLKNNPRLLTVITRFLSNINQWSIQGKTQRHFLTRSSLCVSVNASNWMHHPQASFHTALEMQYLVLQEYLLFLSSKWNLFFLFEIWSLNTGQWIKDCYSF